MLTNAAWPSAGTIESMAGRRKGSDGKTDGWLFAEDIVFSVGRPDATPVEGSGEAGHDPRADADEASGRAGRRRRTTRSPVRRPRASAPPVSTELPPSPPSPVVITPPPANVAAARSMAGPAVTGPHPGADDDPVDGWSAEAVAMRNPRPAFGKRGAVRPQTPVTLVAVEAGAIGRTPSIAPERRVRLLEIATPEHRVEPPPAPARRPVLRALVTVAVLGLVVAGGAAAWVFVNDTGLPRGFAMADLVAGLAPDPAPEPVLDKTALPLRAADAPVRSVPVDAASRPAAADDSQGGGPTAQAVDPLLSSDRISAMGLPGSDDGTVRVVAPSSGIGQAPADGLADPPVAPADDVLRSTTADVAPASDANLDVALAGPPAPADVAAAAAPDPATPPVPAPDVDQAAPAEAPLPPSRPGDDIDRMIAAATEADAADILAGAATLEPDPTPTGSLPDAVAPDPTTAAEGPDDAADRPAGRIIIGRIIPPAEFEARLRGERPIVGQIIPPEAFDTASAIDPATRQTIESLIPPQDVGASPYAAVEPPPQAEAFDVASAQPPAAIPPAASVADVARDNLRVVVHVPRTSDSGLDGRIGETFAAMPGRVEIKVVNVRPDETMVRYYHAEDREAAQALRRQLAASQGDWEVNLSDFTDYRPMPRKGLIEVWLSEPSAAE
jgi:hypothetical protein